MSSRYKVYDSEVPYFLTCTVVNWAEALSRPLYKNIVCESLRYCQEKKGLKLYAWVIMSNHLHLIAASQPETHLSNILRDFKKFTSFQILKAITENPQESRKEWLLDFFRFAGKHNSSNAEMQFWQQDSHPVILDKHFMAAQRLNYLHENPVRAGIVWKAEEYKYSSALDYYTSEKGMLDVTLLEL